MIFPVYHRSIGFARAAGPIFALTTGKNCHYNNIEKEAAGKGGDAPVLRSKTKGFSAAAVLLALALLFALGGCGGNDAELRTGKKLIRNYLSGRGASVTECYVELLRPDGTRARAADYVKGRFRADGEEYQFAVNTVTGGIWTSERLPQFCGYCTESIFSRLGLRGDPSRYVTDCVADCYAPPGKAVSGEFPWARSYLGSVIPVDVADLRACAEEALADEDVRILLFVACHSDELWEDRWSTDDLAGWENVEIQLFGFPAGEPLPSQKDFPTEYIYNFAGPRVTLLPDRVEWDPGT